jgi:hypothetical protein
MDVHTIEGGVSAADVAEAGKIFCLVEADNAEDASTVHREAHGLVANEIYPVSEYS